MRGIVLAGGTGSRLGPLTKVVNKHLLPVSGQPMICWPIQTLLHNGIDEITIVSTPRGIGQLAELLGSGYTYRVQSKPGGITQAIECAIPESNVVDHRYVVVILGDNIFTPPPLIPLEDGNAYVFLKEVPAERAREFGVPTLDSAGKIRNIIEKPTYPTCNLAVTGLYVFPPDVFRKAATIKQSERGETEITDLLNVYAHEQKLEHSFVSGFWGDAGTPEGLAEVNAYCCHKGL